MPSCSASHRDTERELLRLTSTLKTKVVLPREVVESPSLEIFQTCLATVLCPLLWVTLLGQGVGLGDPQRSLPTPNILWFCEIVPGRVHQESHADGEVGWALGQFSSEEVVEQSLGGELKTALASVSTMLGPWGDGYLFTGTFAGHSHKPDSSCVRCCSKSVVGSNSPCCCTWGVFSFFAFLALCEASRWLSLKLFQTDQTGLKSVFLQLSRHQNEFHADPRHQKPPCFLSMGRQGL